MAYKRLGDILVSAGSISQEKLDKALVGAKAAKMRIGEYLTREGLITERQLIDVLMLQLGIDFVDLNKVNIPANLASLVPKSIAKMYNVIPVKEEGDTLYLAMVDPLNFTALEDVKQATRRRVIPLIATEKSMSRAIVLLYGNEGANKAIDELQKERIAISESLQSEEIAAEDSESTAPAIRIVNSIIERGITEGASDIHIEPQEEGLLVRMRIDGVLRKALTIPPDVQSAVI